MTETIKTSLRESKTARWIVLTLISLTMFFAYFFVDVASPLQSLLERNHGWSPETFGMLGGSEFFLNVFAFFLILSGIILDKMGIRFTILTATIAMVLGGFIKYYALTESFAATGLHTWLESFWTAVPGSAKLAFFGFAIFGVGVEMAGITVSKTIVKWFKGKELALAMGLEMALARLGVFAVFRLSPIFAEQSGVTGAIFYGVAFLMVGFLTALIYTFMDVRLDREIGTDETSAPEEVFRISDLGLIMRNPGFLAIASLCVLFYSAIFPFQKFATDMLSTKLDIPIKDAAAMFSYFPIGAMILTPFIGAFLDRKGLGATMMLYGSILLTISHLIFALVPAESFTPLVAYATIVILGVAFSLVPASMWPSIPKIVEERYLGSAYGLTFWIQNIGLLAVPILIGWALTTANPGVAEAIASGDATARYNYTVPELIFAGFGVLAMILSVVLRIVDKKKGYGLDLPNKK
ncbi:MAG TPA: MFS transporter [Bacteroidales bacterium]|nr:MFS transporter [Bacteroidales bacterium]